MIQIYLLSGEDIKILECNNFDELLIKFIKIIILINFISYMIFH